MAPTSSAAELISSNDDLLTQILLRLPAKPLISFKSVCNRWRYLISTRHFSLLWKSLSFSLSLPSAIFFRIFSLIQRPLYDFIPLNTNQFNFPDPLRTFDFLIDPSYLEILQSCNGLWLLSYTGPSPDPDITHYVFNPTTQRFILLPIPGGYPLPTPRILSINLAFDPLRSLHYKVICVLSRPSTHGPHCWVETYTPPVGAWRATGEPFIAPSSDVDFDNGVFWNGKINWFRRNLDTLFCFDLDRNCHLTMPMPPIERPDEHENEAAARCFGESADHLHLVESWGFPSTRFDVFEMETDYSKWVLKYRIDVDLIFAALSRNPGNSSISPFHNCKASILNILHGDIREGLTVVLYMSGMAVSYNLRDKTYKKLRDIAVDSHGEDVILKAGWSIAHQFTESLVPV